MKIITGKAKGMNLETLEGEATRPTSQRVKEAVFSMIQFELEGRKVLDLFAGSGQLGLEALSRGAASCTFIDEAREAVDIIIKNAKNAKLFDRARVSAIDYAAFLRGAAGNEKYDIIFLDPPYASSYVADALRLIDEYELLALGGRIVCETDNGAPQIKRKKVKLTDAPENVTNQVFGGNEELQSKYNVDKTALYGRVRVTLLSKDND